MGQVTKSRPENDGESDKAMTQNDGKSHRNVIKVDSQDDGRSPKTMAHK